MGLLTPPGGCRHPLEGVPLADSRTPFRAAPENQVPTHKPARSAPNTVIIWKNTKSAVTRRVGFFMDTSSPSVAVLSPHVSVRMCVPATLTVGVLTELE